MVKKSKLLAALDAHKGRDYEAEKRLKQVKAAEKRKREKAAKEADEDKENDEVDIERPAQAKSKDDFEDFLEDDADEGVKLNSRISTGAVVPTDEDDEEDEEEDDDVALSELSESDVEDTVPHQRLTINNTTALLAARSRIALLHKHPSPASAPFHIHNSLISPLPPASEAIADPNDDLTRELEFYRIARDAALTARSKLKEEGIPFTRPADYFAEMVKSDEHMDRIKKKMHDQAADRKGHEEARRQRDAKKFGKQVQIAKEQERAKTKRETLDKIKDLKRKRKGNPSEATREDPDDDMFERIDVENSGPKSSSGRERGAGPAGAKRQKKDAKFGFGGKKRFSKSGDAQSSADLSGFSSERMKGRGGGRSGRGGSKRLGKNRRAAAR